MNRPTALTVVIERVHGQLFTRPRMPRSDAYIRGARAGLTAEIAGGPAECPWPHGTVQADAWLAGAEEGRKVGRAVARNDIAELLRLSIEPYAAPVAA